MSTCTSLLGALLLACATTGAAAASYDEVQQIKNQAGIPHWRNNAALALQQHDQAPDTAIQSIWRSLDAQTDPQTGKAPLQQATNPQNKSQLWAHASWLRWRILSENADARYSFAYASNLGRMRDKNGDFDHEAVIFYFHAKLALTLDGNRCTDRSKVEHLMAWYPAQPDLQSLLGKIASLSMQDKSIAMMEAISLEEMRGERPPMAWLCPRNAQDAAASSDADIDLLGSTPRFVSTERWRKYRADLLEQLTRNAAKNL